jgi:hypothetical protein
MKKFLNYSFFASMAFLAIFLMSADHIDAPSVQGGTADIGDYYVFQSQEQSDNMVFAVTLQGLLSPTATSAANFDESVMIEFNIDNDGDNIEDLVIQAMVRDGKVYAFGPIKPTVTGKESMVMSNATQVTADVTNYGESAKIGSANGMKVFAGPRDDPFFFDLGAYQAILGGTAGGFSNPGADTFAGTNVLSIVIEVPKSSLGNVDSINTWVESKGKK